MKRIDMVRQFALVSILGVAVVGSTVLALTRRSDDYAFFDPHIDVKAAVTQRFANEPDTRAMQEGAIRGMLEALDDPYTFYVPPANSENFQRDLTGEYVGIGVAVLDIDGWLTIVTPLDGGPAIDAGLMADDRIVEIEGVSTADKTPDECVELLKGEEGTTVDIVIERDGVRIPKTVERRRIHLQTVRGHHRIGDGQWEHVLEDDPKIGYIRVSQFNLTTADEFDDALDLIGADLTGENAIGGLIIDLRGNPGGIMDAAARMADRFISEGVIVATEYRPGSNQRAETIRAREAGTLPEFPTIVLVDDTSASASEIFAGALQDHGRAVILGTRTFGKASIQGVYEIFSSGGSLKLTEGRYTLPSGRSPHRDTGATEWGVDPDPGFYVPMTTEERIAAIRAQQDEEIIRQREAGEISESIEDPQLKAALKAMRQRIETGDWVPVGGQGLSGQELVSKQLQQWTDTRRRAIRDLARIDKRIEALTQTGASVEDDADDLWPDETELTDGKIQIFDAEGNLVTTLSITGEDLERWLQAAPVETSGN
jgi:carboxyl-terminal processing protease